MQEKISNPFEGRIKREINLHRGEGVDENLFFAGMTPADSRVLNLNDTGVISFISLLFSSNWETAINVNDFTLPLDNPSISIFIFAASFISMYEENRVLSFKVSLQIRAPIPALFIFHLLA